MSDNDWKYDLWEKQYAAAATEEIAADYRRLAQADSDAIARGGRGLIDDPQWSMARAELDRRGVAINTL